MKRPSFQNVWKNITFPCIFLRRSSFIFRLRGKIIFSRKRNIIFLDNTGKVIFQRDFFGKTIFSGSLEKENMLFRAVFMTKITLIFCYSYFQQCRFWGDQKSQFENDTFSKKYLLWKFWVCVYFTLKRYFEEHQLSAFFFITHITQTLLFSGMALLERSKITVPERHLLKRKISYGSFDFVSTLRKKVFWWAPVKIVFL